MSDGLPLDEARARALLSGMVRIRRFEAAAAEMYSAGKIRGFLHLYDGQEAVAVAVMRHLREDDAVVSTYREHGHALARGLPARALMAELYGKSSGSSGGRGGSMHIFDEARRFYGGNAIVAGGIPIAVGMALADKLRGEGRVSAAFFGEGAAAEGVFFESLNLAALWRLPVLFLCENNLYAMGTALARSQAVTDLVTKVRGMGVEARSVDGMDVLCVEDAAADALARVRREGRPIFLECRTYRFRAHSMFDAQLYRSREEVEQWRPRDPIPTFFSRVKELGVLDDEDLADIERRADEEVADAVAFAEASPFEPAETLLEHVYAEEEGAWSR